MLSVERVQSDCWFMLDRRGANYEVYCASLFPAQDWHQLIIYDLSSNDSNTLLGHLEISREVYSTRFWAVAPEALCDSIVGDFVKCHSHWYPIELVYSYGGTIEGKTPLFASVPETH